MENQFGVRFSLPGILSGVLVLFGLYLASLYSYLLFHGLVEIFSIVVACAIFIVTWNVRRLLQNNYFLFIGIAYLFIGGIDLVHTLAYKGMGVFSGYSPNLPTQLWIIARYMESISFLLAPWFVHRKIKPALVLGAYALVTAVFLAAVFHGDLFPDCFVEGMGLTPFKKISEYVISMVLLCAMAFLYQKRKDFDRAVFRLLAASIFLTIGAELAFTFYVSVYGLSNLIGHFLKLISFYLIYKAIIETGLVRPYDLLFRDLKQSEESLKKSRYELVQKAAALEETNLKLQEATRLKSQFLANMSHELRTPLNSIIGFTGIILQGIVGELNHEQRKELNMVYDSAKHLLGLINDILDLAKIEAGKIEIIPAVFELEELVQMVEKMISPLADEKGLTLQVALSQGLPATLFHDKNRIKQVLINLLSNAIKFTETGWVRLEVNAAENISRKDAKTQREIEDFQPIIEFSVTDTGIGIKPEHLAEIFDEFKQIEGPLKEKPAGTGLGLAISRKMVAMMEGQIWAESEHGRGSCFRFTVPVKEMPESKGRSSIPTGQLDPSKKLILTIDDEYEAQEILRTYLKCEGYEVMQAYNGMEAMELARKYLPFAITLDVIMPGKDGWDILHTLKNDPLTDGIPVICISMVDNRELGLSLGAVEYLVKPIDKTRLIGELRRLEKRFKIHDILVIDDDPKAVELVARYIGEEDGYSIRKAYGGKEGLAGIEERRPDLIILDLMMPEVDGFEVIHHLKKSEGTRSIPIMIVSAKELTREEVGYLNGNIEKVIRKGDFRKEDLLRDIKQTLENI